MKNATKKVTLLGLFALLTVIPLIVANQYYLGIIIVSFFSIILASGLNIIMGYTGQISMAQGAFYGIGAYSTALLILKCHLSFWLALPASIMISAFFGILIGYPSLRLRGAYFAIASLCFGLIVNIIITHWTSLTRGNMGLPGIPYPDPILLPFVGKLKFESLASQYYLITIFMVMTVFICWKLVNSRTGFFFIAIGSDEILAESVRINAMKYKVLSFCISAIFAGIGGSLYAGFYQFISPDVSSLDISFNTLVLVVVGGSGTIAGPILGAIFLTLLPEFLQAAKEYRMIIYGVILLVTIIYFPKGLVQGIHWLEKK